MQQRWRDRKRLVIFGLYVLVVAAQLLRHEQWRDEAQAWLLARDLSLPGLFRQMAQEGHPCLWHLLLMPLTRLGLPYASMNVLSALLTSAAVALLLFVSPLPLGMAAAPLAAAPFLYYFPVVSRSYCLIPLFLFCNASLWPNRRRRPLAFGLTIALLVQTHAMMLGFAGCLSLFWLGEALAAYRKDRSGRMLARQAAGLTLPLISLLVLLAQLTGVRDSSAFPADSAPGAVLRRVIQGIAMLFGTGWPPLSIAMAAVFFAGLAAALIFGHRRPEAVKPVLIFALGAGALMVLLAWTIRFSYQGLGCLLAMLLWMLWTAWPSLPKDGKKVRIALICALTAMLVPLVIQNGRSALTDWTGLVSDSRNAAEWLEENVPADEPIVVASADDAASLLPWMSRQTFIDAASGEAVSFAHWKNAEPVISDVGALRAWARVHCPDAESAWLLVSRHPLNDLGPALYETAQPVGRDTYETYYVYRVPLSDAGEES